jgi:glucokinase
VRQFQNCSGGLRPPTAESHGPDGAHTRERPRGHGGKAPLQQIDAVPLPYPHRLARVNLLCYATVYLGVEIGGTKLQAGVCDQRGRLRTLERRLVQRKQGAREILHHLEEIIPPLLEAHHVRAIGVGFGGPVDSARGRVVRSFHIAGWDGFPLRRWFEQRFKLPVVVENDTNVAALAEAVVGAGRGKRTVFYSNVGTGIGGGLVIDGSLYNGRFGAMEIGHTKLIIDGKWIMLEALASGLSIERRKTTLARSAKYYGAALANAITLLNPDVVVVGGGVARAGQRFLKPVRAQVARLVFQPFRMNFKIVPAALGESVVVVGATLLAAKHASSSRVGRDAAVVCGNSATRDLGA